MCRLLTLLSSLLLWSCRDSTPGSGLEPDRVQDTTETGLGSDTSEPQTDPDCVVASEDGQSSSEVGHVVILVLDGTRSEETFGDTPSTLTGLHPSEMTPMIRSELWPQGALISGALATGVTNTAEGHVDLLSGYRLPQSNLASHDGPGFYRPELPTLFEAVRQQRGLDSPQVAFVSNTPHLVGHTWSLYPGMGAEFGVDYDLLIDDETGDFVEGDVETLDAAWQTLVDHEVSLMMVNLHTADRAGHHQGAEDYISEIQDIDGRIVEFWNDLQAHPDYSDDTVMVLVSDHGRHREEYSSEDWRGHGDQCSGCREIPMFLIGPGIAEGADVALPFSLSDLGQTAAWLMGVDLPNASGILMNEVLADPPGVQGRCGEVSPSVTPSSSVAVQEYLTRPEGQSRVQVDGETVSAAHALMAEAPRLAEGLDGSAVVCWRQLSVGEFDIYDHLSWNLRCSRRTDGAWQDMSIPVNAQDEEEVSPWLEPAVSIDNVGQVWIAFFDNPVADGQSGRSIRVLRWTEDAGWTGEDNGFERILLGTHTSMAVDGGRAWIAFTAMEFTENLEKQKASRYTFHVELLRVAPDETDRLQYVPALRTYNHAYGQEGDTRLTHGRSTRPEVWAQDPTVRLAYIAYDGDSESDSQLDEDEDLVRQVMVIESDRNGNFWSDPVSVDDSGRVLGHSGLSWSEEGSLDWARLSEAGTVEICRLSADASSSCQDTGSRAIDGLSALDDRTVASLQAEDGVWTLTEVSW